MKIKGRVLRDGGALSGLQLGLMAAEHRPSSPLIWMSTRRLVLCLPASLCALPLAAACQRIALAARWPPPAMPRSLINILRWRPISRNAAGRTNGVRRSRRPLAVYRQKTEKFGGTFGETATSPSSHRAPFQRLPKRMQILPTALEQAEIVPAGGAGITTALVQGGARIHKNKTLAVVT